jgi:hypothetical protein
MTLSNGKMLQPIGIREYINRYEVKYELVKSKTDRFFQKPDWCREKLIGSFKKTIGVVKNRAVLSKT